MDDVQQAEDNGGTLNPGGLRQSGSSRIGGPTTALLWILGLAVACDTIYAGWLMWIALQTAYESLWQRLWIAVYVLFGLALVYISASMLGPVLGRLVPFLRQVRSQAERVRAAAIAGDEKLAPLAAEQPEPLPASELPIGSVTFGPFTPGRSQRSRRLPGCALTGVVGVASVIALGIVYMTIVAPYRYDLPLAIMRPMFILMLVLMLAFVALSALIFVTQAMVALVRRLRGTARPERLRLVVDEWGIRPLGGRRRPDRQSIAWHEVRAFYQAADLLRLEGSVIRKSASQKTTYTIATAERVLSWTIWENSPAERKSECERLCRLVVARTGLPLRDVTAFATQLAADMLELASPLLLPLPDRRLSIHEEQNADAADVAPTRDALPATSPALRRVGASWPRWLMASRVAALAIAMLALTAGMLAQGFQDFQYLNLLQQHIDSELPYYDIDFRTNDGAWPSHAATATGGSYVFKPDGYYITGAPGGRAMEAVLPQQYGDATVELTAGLAGVNPAGDIGVVLHESDDGTDKVVFTLTSTGGWSLFHMDAVPGMAPQRDVLTSDDHSDSVQTGTGAYNYLAVIMRGSDYLCFVRDRLVGIYHDSSSQTPRQGHVGLWLGNSHAVGWFYSFAVYPAY